MKFRPLIGITIVALSFSSLHCGKKVALSDLSSPISGTSDGGPGGNTSTTSCTDDQRVFWKFYQPKGPRTQSLDFLIVVDTSASMSDKRTRIASAVPHFIQSLSPNLDYQIAVMLGHGGASSYSGRLYSASGVPKVLSSKSLSSSQIQTYLRNNLENVKEDVDEANGEALFYSLTQSLNSSRLNSIRKLGFYRENAALAVLFIADENDVCYPSELHGYTQFPDFAASEGGIERKAYNKYCVKADGVTPSISPESLNYALRQFQNQNPLTLGAIYHTDPALVPHRNEETIGHGFDELIKKDFNSVGVEITQLDYSSKLSQLAKVVNHKVNLMTEFQLDGTFQIDSATIMTRVDSKWVASRYDDDSRSIGIRAEDAGQSGSEIEVSACAKNDLLH